MQHSSQFSTISSSDNNTKPGKFSNLKKNRNSSTATLTPKLSMKSFTFQSMATLGVLNYNLPPGLTMKVNNANSNSSSSNMPPTMASGLGKAFNKITVQNVLSENNSNALNIAQGNPNAIVRKIKDFGMIGTVNSAGANTSLNLSTNSRKRTLSENQKPTTSAKKERKSSTSTAKKPKLSKEERSALRLAKKAAKENSGINTLSHALPSDLQIKVPGTPGRKGLPLPQAVARRNARERNRVKQVNNGFAALRDRIPEEVAEAFEAHSTCKNNGKKLSKVETLRMAVEYIRSLERLLGFDFPLTSGKSMLFNSSSGEDSFSMIKDEFEAFSPSMDDQFDDSLSHYDSEEYYSHSQTSPISERAMVQPQPPPQAALSPPSYSPPPQIDSLPNITTLNGLQYIRIPGTNTYQLLTPDIFVGSAASPPSSTVDEEHFNALIDTNCVSPSSLSMSSPTSLAHVTADMNASPPAAITGIITARAEETAPVSLTNTKCENSLGSASLLSSSTSSAISTALRISPVPLLQQQHQQQMRAMLTAQTSLTSSSSSPSASATSPVNETSNLQQATTPAIVNEQQQREQLQGLRQTCAVNQQQRSQQRLEVQLIKQEYEEPNIIYHQQHPSSLQQHHHQLYLPTNSMAMSPPLDRQTPTTSSSAHSHMQQFYNPDSQQAAQQFFDGVANLKKEFTEDFLDAAHTSNVLSDESMIESIDWWEAHTPKSEGGSVML